MFRSKVISFFLVISVLGCTAQIVLPKPELNGRFVGDPANIEEAPSQVSIELLFSHICSGNIIGDDLILTAGQCVWKRSRENLRVRVGTDTYGRGGKVFQIKNITVHEDFDDRSKDFDFAIIWLEDKIDFNDKTSPVEISAEEPTAGSEVTAYGWSSVGFRRNLQKVNAIIITGVDCLNIYKRYGPITQRMICANIDISTRDRYSCGGDVGGALFILRGNKPVLAGVISFGYGCSRPKYPIVHSNVAAVSDWIQINVVKN